MIEETGRDYARQEDGVMEVAYLGVPLSTLKGDSAVSPAFLLSGIANRFNIIVAKLRRRVP